MVTTGRTIDSPGVCLSVQCSWAQFQSRSKQGPYRFDQYRPLNSTVSSSGHAAQHQGSITAEIAAHPTTNTLIRHNARCPHVCQNDSSYGWVLAARQRSCSTGKPRSYTRTSSIRPSNGRVISPGVRPALTDWLPMPMFTPAPVATALPALL